MTAPTLTDLSSQLTDTQSALNMIWTLFAGFLIMFMQCGFALIESGLTRAKSVAHTMGMNLLVYAIGIAGYWSVGFALQMGGVGPLTTFGGDATLNHEFTVSVGGHDFGLWGTEGFFLGGKTLTPAVATVFFFQMVFMDTALTIPTGALAERWKFASFVIFSFVMSALIYPLYANWVWGGGFLSALGRNFGLGHGHVDFAGSSVVHLTGGVVALIGAKRLGPRIGKYTEGGEPRAIPGHSIVLAVTGTFVLAFGWFGFNAGSTLSAMDSRLAIVAVNTMLASASGALCATFYVWSRFGKPDVTWMCNGMLAGLVAITAPCAFVSAPFALGIGAVAGVLVVRVAMLVEEKLRIDDPVGAIAVHGANGMWGVLALGLFANGSYGEGLNGVPGGVRGAFYGDGGQLMAALIAIAVNVVFVGATASLTFAVIERLVGNRVRAVDELDGLDLPEMGIEGYSPEYRGIVSEQFGK